MSEFSNASSSSSSPTSAFKVLYIGGEGVGKTSLISRIMALPFPTSYRKTSIYDLHVLRILGHVCNLYDVASDIMSREPDVLSMIFRDISAVFVMVDAGSANSLNDADKWMKLLFKLNIPVEKITLLMNKADTPSLVNQNILDTFIALGGCSGWYWTVAHARFKDYCPSRGRMENQEPPMDILIWKVRDLISQKRKYLKSTAVALDIKAAEQARPINRCGQYRGIHDPKDLNDEVRVEKSLSDEGWDFYAGILSREEAHEILEDRIPGSFLIRRSDFNYSIRIVAKREDGSYSHIPISKRNGKYIISVINEETKHTPSDHGATDAAANHLAPHSAPFIQHQSKQPLHRRGNMYDTLLDVIESVGLNTIEGIRFVQRSHF